MTVKSFLETLNNTDNKVLVRLWNSPESQYVLFPDDYVPAEKMLNELQKYPECHRFLKYNWFDCEVVVAGNIVYLKLIL